MTQEDESSYEQRIVQLEREVRKLKELVNSLVGIPSDRSRDLHGTDTEPATPVQPQQSPPTTEPRTPAASMPAAPARTTKSFSLPDHMKTSEYWLNKVGIGLVLFAVLFFFKYSIDQGWLTPSVRIGMGVAFGAVLDLIGLRIYRRRRHFSLVLLGGGIATLYITGFAAFQMFKLVPHLTAMGFMVAVTVFAIGISLKQKEQVLSLIGAMGGLATPFLLYTGQGNIPGLITYTCLLVGGIAAIYFFRSWRALLWFTIISGWLIMTLACDNVTSKSVVAGGVDYWAAQYGLIFCWLAFGMMPLLRELFGQIRPEKFAYIKFEYLRRVLSEDFERSAKQHAIPLVVSSPLIAFGLSMSIWERLSTDQFWGWIALGVAAVYGAVAYGLKRWEGLKKQAYIHMMLGILFLTISFSLLLDGNSLLITLATEALALFLIARKFTDRGIAKSSNILFLFVGLWLFNRIAWDGPEGSPLFNVQALTDLWAVVTALAVAKLTAAPAKRRIYLIASFVCLGGLMIREFDDNTLFVILTSLVVAYHFVANRINDRICIGFGHLFFGVVGVWLADRLLLTRIMAFPIDLHRTPLLNLTTLADLTYLAALGAVSQRLKAVDEKRVYFLGLHIAILALFLREFQGIENGQGYVSIAWGVYASALLIAGLRLDYVALRKTAIVTLMFIVGKLFLIDLANLETIWRILLFLGVGGVFLLLSYFFKSMWKGRET